MVVKPRVDNEGVDGDLDDVVNIGRPTPTLVILKPTPPMNNKYGSKKLAATFTFVTGISGPQGYLSALCRVVLLLVRRHKYITDNELAYLECIHLFVEILDHFFSNVCELDLVFNFHKVLVQTVREKDSTTFSGICIINLIFLSKFPNR